VLLVVAGAWLLNMRHARLCEPAQLGAPLFAIFHEPGSRMMLTVALIFSSPPPWARRCWSTCRPEQFGPFYFRAARPGDAPALVSAGARPPWMLRAGEGGHAHRGSRCGAFGGARGRCITVAALNGVMIVTHFAALARVEVAYMVAVKRTSLLFGILYGALLFREPGLRSHLAAGVIMVVGVAAIVSAG
jgi:drug/metabolite transporter (DMT)-like permease